MLDVEFIIGGLFGAFFTGWCVGYQLLIFKKTIESI